MNSWILSEISEKFVPKDPINNIPSLVQIIAWRRPGDKPLFEPMMVSLLTYVYASLGLNELIHIQPIPCFLLPGLAMSLKRKCRHFDEIFITGCTGSCHFDNFQCSQWWKFHQNEDISVSVVVKSSAAAIRNFLFGFHDSGVNTLRPEQNGSHLQTTFWNTISWIKIIAFWLKFHWILFLREIVDNKSSLIQLIGLALTRRQSIT